MLRELIDSAVVPYYFEPNTERTRTKISNAINKVLKVVPRLKQFKVLDKTTPENESQNTVHLYVGAQWENGHIDIFEISLNCFPIMIK